MGQDIESITYTREQRQRFRQKVHLCLDVFERMLAYSQFDFERPMTGMEIELNLTGSDFRPKMDNALVLERIADPEYQTELARYNIEFNVKPRELGGDSMLSLEGDLRASLNRAHDTSAEVGSKIVMVGILPTVTLEDFEGDWMSANARYHALNDAMLGARGEDVHLDIEGPTGEHLERYFDSLAPEAACTSMQLHLQVAPLSFADHWNAAQALAGAQLALAANSPFFLGKRLWAESRIPVFSQAVDTRSPELKNQGVRPRVWFGERWITSIFDLFEENVRYFPALLPETTDEDPSAVLDAGGVPALAEMRLHNGTVYRWNRPIYDIGGGRPHVRVENRVLPAGPTIVDTLANAAFYYGALRMLAQEDRPVWSRMSFAAAEDNFLAGARDGLEAKLYWPGRGDLPATELILRHLLPLANEGLRDWGVSTEARDRYLSVIEGRCLTGVNGATWQTATVAALEERGIPREEALRQMVATYSEHMHANNPVHTWPMP
ncbi:MAG TPA: glutamate--cysteine ligase [Dermatophilaceae bacterium]|jgi:gamma-glutamyl:cysteine ligase YbdK (ATP-grasp superfamily)|nr:glutamate--cysteine ligase [Dermatophilaceae bacterium]HPZ68661.1 glutamate--cysteine ligase [Dermatophilaceae bacterium]HQD00718.1 glutamate--cysteine ligase [Dermatophilaceae bacterium]